MIQPRIHPAILAFALWALALATFAPAQTPADYGKPLVLGDAPSQTWRLRAAPGGAKRRALSLIMVGEGPGACFGETPALAAARIAVLPSATPQEQERGQDQVGAALRSYRLSHAPRQSRHILVARGAHCPQAVEVLAAWPHEFRGLVLLDTPTGLKLDDPRLTRLRNLSVLADADTLDAWTRALPESRRRPLAAKKVQAEDLRWLAGTPPSIGSIEDTLDTFHRAAATGDEDTYFPLFSEDAVFLGTDASERWTKSAFETFARPYFSRESAWIFIPQNREVTQSADGSLAWFDETLGSRSYGACRGSGVLKKVDGRWLVAQYNLGVPVPNDLLAEVVADIKRREIGAQRPLPTTVILVRHAEKASETARNPDLSERGQKRARQLARQLAGLAPTALYATEYKRTQQTLAPLAESLGLTCQVHPGRDPAGLIQRVRNDHAGQVVVIAGHSNTVPALARALGAPAGSYRKKTTYDDLLLITLSDRGVRCLPLAQGMEPKASTKEDPVRRPTSRPKTQPAGGGGR